MAISAMAVGNHEFDHGKAHLLEKLKPLANFPLLSANVVDDSGNRLFEASLVREYPASGTRVIIFGLTTDHTPVTTHLANVVGVVFGDPVRAAKDLVAQARGEDLVIALTHLAVEKAKELAAACPRIAVIVGGHSHTALFEPLKVGNTLIVQAGAYAKYIGRLDLDFEKGRIVNYHGELIPLTEEIEEDPEMEALINEYKAKLDVRLGEVIGKTEVFLDGTRSVVRSGRSSNLGKLIGYTMTRAVNAQVAVINGGAIRSSIMEGEISVSDVYTVLPFQDHLVKMDLKGKDLLAVLQRSADLPEGSGGKLQTYGITYETADGKIRIEKVGNAEFRPDETYSVATNDFLAEGGDGYDILKNNASNVYESPMLVTDMVIKFIREKKVIDATVVKSVM
jgi:5'-nucleotidase